MFDDLRGLADEPDDDIGDASDEDFLAAFGEAATPTFEDEPAPASAAPAFGDEPMFGEESDVVKEKKDPGRLILGMTAQQRAVLSVFLFLDVSVLGCVFLLALGRVAF